MKKGTFWLVITLLMVTSMVLASCGTSTTTSTTTAKTTTQTNTVIPSSTTSPTTTTKVSTTTPTSTTGANWWDKLGKPQYGGTIVYSSGFDFTNHDPFSSMGGASMETAWMDKLASDNWTIDPAVFNYRIAWRPPQYVGGQLAQSWEFTSPNTLVFHLRQGVRYQNIDPVNGRELTSADIVYHYQRLYGLGSSMKGAAALATSPMAQTLSTITANDKYTVTMVWKSTNPEYITETWQAAGGEHCIEAKEAVDKWGDLTDWHHAVGTGPFIMKDLVSGASVTLSKNPTYWAYDERYPQNQLPYADTLKILIIADNATAMAALRTGKIDVIENISSTNAQAIMKSNPEIQQTLVPYSCLTIDPRYDKAPFSDLKVRKAMQMAIDLPTIASTYYAGNSPATPSSLTSMYETGWDLPYAQWPQALKDEYTYNPKAAKQLLTDAGFPNGFKTNCVADSGGDLDLLQIVKSYFMAIGIDMSIQTMDSASWTTYVRTQRKQDALAYRSSGQIGMSYEPLRQFLRYTTGYAANYTNVSDPKIDDFYAKAMAGNNMDDIKKLLQDLNLYFAQQHFETSLIYANLYALNQPWLKGYSAQNFSVSGGSSGPLFLGFYASRFWVDAALKKSFGK